MKDEIKFGISVIIILLLVIIFIPAYYSTKDLNFGFKTYGYYNPNNDTIVLFKNSTYIMKHELCHRNQHYENRSYGKENFFGSYVNELECYIKMYL